MIQVTLTIICDACGVELHPPLKTPVTYATRKAVDQLRSRSLVSGWVRVPASDVDYCRACARLTPRRPA